MSEVAKKQKSFLSDIRVGDYMAGAALAGVVYLYTEINSVNTNLNKRIIEITHILKRMNRNSRILDMQLTSHLHHHQMEEKDPDIEEGNSTTSNNTDAEFREEIFARLKYLEDRVAYFETVNNPMVTKQEKIKAQPSPYVTSNDTMNPMFTDGNASKDSIHVNVSREYKGDETQPIH